MSNLIEEVNKNCDLVINSQFKVDSRVYMVTGDVGSDGNRHKQSKIMTDSHGYQFGWVEGGIRR